MFATTHGSSATERSWRTSLAIRVFGLSVATGSLLSAPAGREATPLLVALVLIVVVTTFTDRILRTHRMWWLTAGEAVLVGILTGSMSAPLGLLAYLAVPPIVAGARHGLVSAVNVTLASGFAAILTLSAGPIAQTSERVAAMVSWLSIGMGVGLLAGWQSRSARDLAARQAPYVTAHQLMGRLHRMASSGSVGLDAATLAMDLDAAMRQVTGGARTSVFVLEPDGQPRALLAGDDAERMLAEIDIPEDKRTPGAGVVVLRGAQRVLGHCVVVGVGHWTDDIRSAAHEVADDFALRLDTAVLFDEIRHLSASEERNRIARDMHDGVAQEVVALGYVVDEIESVSHEPATLRLAASLRDEISRVVTELRYSIFDLRQGVGQVDLTTALTDYVHELSRDCDLRVHLVLDNVGSQLPTFTQSELFRIAQEAISNVRRHARATNLWITLVVDESVIRLEVADDGVGGAMPRDRHWGLQTMQERAQGIGAEISIAPRPGGGTLVGLLTSSSIASQGRAHNEHHSPAR